MSGNTDGSSLGGLRRWRNENPGTESLPGKSLSKDRKGEGPWNTSDGCSRFF